MAIRQLLNSATKQKCIITYDDERIYHVARWETGGQEASHVLPGILAGCDAAGIAPTALQKILVVHGPGSFTGLRVAVTVVNMMKTTMPQLQICALTAGQLLAHADNYTENNYIFAPYPSDFFLFDREGNFVRRDAAGQDMQIPLPVAGEIVPQLEARMQVRPVNLGYLEQVGVLQALEKRLQSLEGQLLPFYAKDANITTPKNPVQPLQH